MGIRDKLAKVNYELNLRSRIGFKNRNTLYSRHPPRNMPSPSLDRGRGMVMCPRCGEKVSCQANFCHRCGARFR